MTANVSIIRKAALSAVAALLLTPVARAGIDIRIEPPVVVVPAVVVAPAPIVVVQDPWVVGYRQNLYDADLRLRVAQADQYQARLDLDSARAREADLGLDVDDQQAVVIDLKRKIEVVEVNPELRGQIAQAALQVDAAKGRVADAQGRVVADKAVFDSVHAAGQPEFDAASHFHHSEAALNAAQADLDDATGRLAALQARDVVVDVEPSRRAMRGAEAKLADLRVALDQAHEDVWACQQRLEDRSRDVCVALHDRDEALWLMHSKEIMEGVVDCSAFGFVIEPGWRGHWHGDIEAFHAYCVHPVDFWVASPTLVVDRVSFVDVHVNEIVKVREVESVHAVEKLKVVQKFETNVKIDERKKVFEVVKTEHERFTTEKTERATAAKEGRKPTFTYSKPADVQVAQLRHADAKLTKENRDLTKENKALETKDRDEHRDIKDLKDEGKNGGKADEAKPDLTHRGHDDTGSTATDPGKRGRGTTPDTGTSTDTGGRHRGTPADTGKDTGTGTGTGTDTGGRRSHTPPADTGTSTDTGKHGHDSGTTPGDTGTSTDPGKHGKPSGDPGASSGSGTGSTDTGSGRHGRGSDSGSSTGDTGKRDSGTGSTDTGKRGHGDPNSSDSNQTTRPSR